MRQMERKGLAHRTPLRSKTPLKRTVGKKTKVSAATTRRRNKNRCDKLFSCIIKTRDKYCQNCGDPNNLQNAHLLRRSQGDWTYTRLDNAVALCQSCHTYYTHHEPEWGFWIEDHFNRDHYMKLKQIAHEGVRKKFDWLAEYERLCIYAREHGLECKGCK